MHTIKEECDLKREDANYQFKRLAGYGEKIANSSVEGVFGFDENEEKMKRP